jgi:outer membrane protein OmpA-like peptidoglycan-associated protein
VNSPYNEGAPNISPDGRYLFFAGCEWQGGLGSCDIYVSKKIGDSLRRPFNLFEPVNSEYWESQPSIAPDGKTLYFASNRKGGKGGGDIWVSQVQENGMWSEPVNLGDSVNSTGGEASPFIHYDNQTLYFVSDGHAGLGGKDIFYVKKKLDGTWGKPVNLGYPINTHKDEISFFVNSTGDMGYIASDRSGGKGGQDIYAFELYREARPLAVSYLRGKLFDASSLDPLNAKFEIINLKTGEVVAGAESDEMSGDFLVSLPSDGNYALNVSKDGYLFHSENFELGDIANQIKPKTIDVPLAEIKTGESMVLRNIFFESNEYKLKAESTTELERLVKMMTQNPNLKIEISGHTDNTGSEAVNQRLSENRAKAVYDFLISRNIAANRLKYVGYGLSKPIAPNDTEAGRAQNRRTEVKII